MRLTGQIVLLVVALSAILSAGGCGGGKSGSTAGVVNQYHQAIMDMDIETVMSLSAPGTDRGKVEALLGFRSEGLKRGGLPPIVSEKIDGDTAVVTCKFGPSEQDVELVKVDGQWKVK